MNTTLKPENFIFQSRFVGIVCGAESYLPKQCFWKTTVSTAGKNRLKYDV